MGVYDADAAPLMPVVAGVAGSVLPPPPQGLPPRLMRMHRRYRELVEAVADGRLDRRGLKLALSKLPAADAEGRMWTIGATSGRFYVSTEDGWVLADATAARFHSVS